MGVVITSAPGPIPSVTRAVCSPAVHELRASAGGDAATNLQLRWRCATMRTRPLRSMDVHVPERVAEPVERRCGLPPPLWQVPYSAWSEPDRRRRRCRLSPCCTGGCPCPSGEPRGTDLAQCAPSERDANA